MRKENIKIVDGYLNALKKKDLSLAPLADEVKFTDPIAGEGAGAENFKAFLSGFLPAIKDVRVFSHVCENETVITHFAAETIFGTISILEKFVVKDGKISELHGFYDPRPIVGG